MSAPSAASASRSDWRDDVGQRFAARSGSRALQPESAAGLPCQVPILSEPRFDPRRSCSRRPPFQQHESAACAARLSHRPLRCPGEEGFVLRRALRAAATGRAEIAMFFFRRAWSSAPKTTPWRPSSVPSRSMTHRWPIVAARAADLAHFRPTARIVSPPLNRNLTMASPFGLGPRRRPGTGSALAREPLVAPETDLHHIARDVLARREELLACLQDQPTPAMSLTGRIRHRAGRVPTDFDRQLPVIIPFAVSPIRTPACWSQPSGTASGLDVSSGRELSHALSFPDCPIVFPGPPSPKTITTGPAHSDRVTVHLDSFRELRNLAATAERCRKPIRAGVRVSPQGHGSLVQIRNPTFGSSALPAPGLGVSLAAARGRAVSPELESRSPPLCRQSVRLAQVLATLEPAERARLRFIDIGGGFRPHGMEGYFPTDHPQGSLFRHRR